MAGWRLGMAVGNPEVISYLHTYKSQADSSTFQAVMDAGVVALTRDQSWIETRNQVYQERRDIVVKALKSVNFDVDFPPAAIYVWAKLPPQYTDSTTFCMDLLEQTGVSLTPGIVYGKYGEGYIRISLGMDTAKVKESMQRLTNWMSLQPHAGRME
jgi:LL-diaminopimelate aminotransferase